MVDDPVFIEISYREIFELWYIETDIIKHNDYYYVYAEYSKKIKCRKLKQYFADY